MQQRLNLADDKPDPEEAPDMGGNQKRVYTVSELTRNIKMALSSDPKLQSISVIGEVSEMSVPSSGHVYFTLKDEGSVISCVMWRNTASRIRFGLNKGLKVQVNGSINIYERQGKYQFYVTSIMPFGKGALHLAFEQLKKKLEAEGLFDADRKRPIPSFPKKVGIVTSTTAAALQDIIRVSTERWPLAHLIISPARVQGETSAQEIVSAIGLLNEMQEVDVIIVGRGGGSIEDLWSFNEEIVARAIFSSKIPVVTGIGHEVDRTISDYVADRVAATPSQAAEVVFPDHLEIMGYLEDMAPRLGSRLRTQLADLRKRYDLLATSRSLERPKDLIGEYRQTIDEVTCSLMGVALNLVATKRASIDVLAASLAQMDPRAILERGYSITIDDHDNIIKDPQQVDEGSLIRIIVHRGKITGRVEARQRGEEDGEEDQG